MKSITIHGLDDAVARLIGERAKAERRSLNRTIKSLLEEALGVRPRDTARHAKDFAEFLGVWSKSDAAAFDHATADLRRVEPEEWRG
jgi:hypothetical protein